MFLQHLRDDLRLVLTSFHPFNAEPTFTERLNDRRTTGADVVSPRDGLCCSKTRYNRGEIDCKSDCEGQESGERQESQRQLGLGGQSRVRHFLQQVRLGAVDTIRTHIVL